jgi:hypothetical protein
MPNAKITSSSYVARLPGAEVSERVIGIAPMPILFGEKQVDYVTLATRIAAGARPTDAIEEILTRDVIDLSWEVLRLRRAKAGLMRAAAGDGVRKILSTIGHKDSALLLLKGASFAEEWASGKESTRLEFKLMLKKAELTMDDVMAEALASKIESFERLDRMLASSEARRNNALREIDRHRAALGAAMRQAIDEVQEAEFHDVETGAVDGGTPP